MVSIFPPLSIWVQLANVFFALAGIYGDLFVIRFLLFVAYFFLFLQAALGGPLWGSLINNGKVAVDGLVWSIIGMYIHGSSMVCLILDERKVDLTEDEDVLWRMFYRTGGLSALLFKKIVASHLEVVEFEANVDVPVDNYFYILYKGRVQLRIWEDEKVITERICQSGEMFDFKLLGSK
jgi:hypothetical protein